MDFLPFAHQLVREMLFYRSKIKVFHFVRKKEGYKQKADTTIGEEGTARPHWNRITNSINFLLEGERKERGTGKGPSIEDAEIKWHFWYSTL